MGEAVCSDFGVGRARPVLSYFLLCDFLICGESCKASVQCVLQADAASNQLQRLVAMQRID